MILLFLILFFMPCFSAEEPPKTTFMQQMEQQDYKCPVCKKEINLSSRNSLFFFNKQWYHLDCWYVRHPLNQLTRDSRAVSE